MRLPHGTLTLLLVTALAACRSDGATGCCPAGDPSLRVVNGFTTAVDALIDGEVVIQGLAAGAVGTTDIAPGGHTLVLRPAGAGAPVSRPITIATGAVNTIAAVRAAGGALGSAVLDDTGSVVPAGATKLRVLHLAPNAGTLQVYRTQPDYQQPISWQFPFNYQPDPTSLSAPFYQSTVGSWEVRIWQAPADSTGWATAPVQVVVPLGGGEKKTILILDAAGGGVKAEVI